MNEKSGEREDKTTRILASIRKYRFELKHIMVLFIIVVSAQILISLTQKSSLQRFLKETQNSYQKDSSERLSNLTATALELLLTTSSPKKNLAPEESQQIVEALNIILSQQLLLQGVEGICVLVEDGKNVKAIDNGQVLYDYFFGDLTRLSLPDTRHDEATALYKTLKNELKLKELIQSELADEQTFHVFVPFVPKGEFAGALYIKNKPDFTFITEEITSSFNESSLIFSGLIFFGFLAMFFISSYTLRERDDARKLLFTERERQLKEHIDHQKETLFTKRIYHTHHKAEKIMGFIKEDLRALNQKNIDETRGRVTKYANFISRVIYDMKWYDPPLQTVRSPLFRTDLNKVIRFMIDNICLRVSKNSAQYLFQFDLDDDLPPVPVNEFVVWEILEPLFQNSMDHNPDSAVTIGVKTEYLPAKKISRVIISDNGIGFAKELFQLNEKGTKRIFLENISTKEHEKNSGYGCYLAYEISKQRCGWQLDAENPARGGCRFVLTIPN